MTKNGEWQVDLSHIDTMKTYREWTQQWNVAIASNDYDVMYRLMSKTVRAWPFDNDPSDIGGYDAMHPRDFAQALDKVGEAIRQFFRNAPGRN